MQYNSTTIYRNSEAYSQVFCFHNAYAVGQIRNVSLSFRGIKFYIAVRINDRKFECSYMGAQRYVHTNHALFEEPIYSSAFCLEEKC